MWNLGKRSVVCVLQLLILMATFVCHCGGGVHQIPQTSDDTGRPYGSARMVVTNSRAVDAGEGYGVIRKYMVTVSGPGIGEPIVAEFDGDATSGVVGGIPSGDGREVAVQAVNMGDRLIREGEAAGVTVTGGGVTDVEVSMDAVPIFVNLEDGNAVLDRRLKFRLFADPEDPLEVRDLSGDSEGILTDMVTGLKEVYPDIASGLATVVPEAVSVGRRTFEVRSERTGRASTVEVNVLDGSQVHPAPLFSGGPPDGATGQKRIGYGPDSLMYLPGEY